jgi:hypothetical protein
LKWQGFPACKVDNDLNPTNENQKEDKRNSD